MSIVSLVSPSGESSIQDNLWHIATSDNSGQVDFKYVFDVYKGSEQLVRVKVFPDPTNGKGYFDASPVVRNEVTYDWFDPSVYTKTLNMSGEAGLSYQIRVGEDVSAVMTTNMASGNVNAYNYVAPLYKRRKVTIADFNNKWVSNRPKYATLSLTDKFMLGFRGTLVNPDFSLYGNSGGGGRGITVHPNGSIYIAGYQTDIYKQTDGFGDFVGLNQTQRSYWDVAAAPNEDVYATEEFGDIYLQSSGSGNFTALGQTARQWRNIAVAPNGNVFATVYNGSIYKQTGGTGNFVTTGTTSRKWSGLCVAPNGDIYATTEDAGIFISTNAGSTFTSTGASSDLWYGITATSNGDIYAVKNVYGGINNYGELYKRTAGTGSFTYVSNIIQPCRDITTGLHDELLVVLDNGSQIFIAYTALTLKVTTYDYSNNIIGRYYPTNYNFSIPSTTLWYMNLSPSKINNSLYCIDESVKYYTIQYNNYETFTFNLECEKENTINLFFINELGNIDTARFSLVNRLTKDVERKSYQKRDYRFGTSSVDYYDSNNVYYESKINYGSKAMWSYKLKMNYPTDDEYRWLHELITSPLIYAYIDGDYYPVTIKNTNYEYSEYRFNKLREFEIDIELNQIRNGFRR